MSPSKHHRHRSYTVSSKITPVESHTNETTAAHASKTNWCGYDSMLHAKICSTNNIISNPVLSAHASKLLHNYNSNHNNSTPNCNNKNNRNSRSRHRHHNEFPISASPQVQGYTKLMSMQNTKLNTVLLNQLNPQLTQEQKLTRTISHVEKWLADDANNLLDISKNVNCKGNNLNKETEINNVHAVSVGDKFKENEKLTKKLNDKKQNEVFSPSKRTFNKNRKTPKSSLSSSQRNSSNSDSQGKGSNNISAADNTVAPKPKESVVEYASIPIVDPSQSECENLLRASSDESSSQIGMTDNASLTTIHRCVHIHHHYYHH